MSILPLIAIAKRKKDHPVIGIRNAKNAMSISQLTAVKRKNGLTKPMIAENNSKGLF